MTDSYTILLIIAVVAAVAIFLFIGVVQIDRTNDFCAELRECATRPRYTAQKAAKLARLPAMVFRTKQRVKEPGPAVGVMGACCPVCGGWADSAAWAVGELAVPGNGAVCPLCEQELPDAPVMTERCG